MRKIRILIGCEIMSRNMGFDENSILQAFIDLKVSEVIAKIYIYLVKVGGATSKQIIEETKLYPSAVRKALSQMYHEGFVKRIKLNNDGVGRKPFLFKPATPKEVVDKLMNRVRERFQKLQYLNQFFEKRSMQKD